MYPVGAGLRRIPPAPPMQTALPWVGGLGVTLGSPTVGIEDATTRLLRVLLLEYRSLACLPWLA